jgi:hypothetical protein
LKPTITKALNKELQEGVILSGQYSQQYFKHLKSSNYPQEIRKNGKKNN